MACNLIPGISLNELKVMIVLANRDGNGGCHPSVAGISEASGIPRRKVMAALRSLDNGGAISRIKDSGRKTSYILHYDRWSGLNPLHRATICNLEPVTGKGASHREGHQSPGRVQTSHREGSHTSHREGSKPVTGTVTRTDSTESIKRTKEAVSPSAPSPRRGVRLPDDWLPSPADVEWAMQQEGCTQSLIQNETDKFRDYWHAEAGQKASKLDWSKAWKVWMRRSLERSPRSGSRYYGPHMRANRRSEDLTRHSAESTKRVMENIATGRASNA